MSYCINLSNPEYIALREQAAETEDILRAKIIDWQNKNSTDRFPSLKEIGVKEKPAPIKPGVQELFDSNPEIANAVYEALGFKERNQVGENPFNTVVNFDLNKIRAVSGKLGEQGATPDGIRNLLKYVGVDLTNVNTDSTKAMADYLRSNPSERNKV